jgi:sugar lactone lactonase YvrE
MGRCLATLFSQPQVSSIVVGRNEMYWVTSTARADGGSTRAIWKESLGGGAPAVLYDAFKDRDEPWDYRQANQLAVDATSLYWSHAPSDNVDVLSMPVDASHPPEVIATGGWNTACGVAVDQNNIYWATSYKDGYVMKASLNGTHEVSQLATGQMRCPSNLTVDGGRVYWLECSTISCGATLLMTLSQAGEKPQPESLLTWQDGWGRFAVGPTGIYWTDAIGGSVMGLTVGAAPRPRFMASDLDTPRDIAIDGSHAYWTSFAGGQVLELDLINGTRSVLATGQNQPRGLVIDATSIYWIVTAGDSEAVMRLTPK